MRAAALGGRRGLLAHHADICCWCAVAAMCIVPMQRGGTAAVEGVQFATVDGFQGRECDVVLFSCVRWGPCWRLAAPDEFPFLATGRLAVLLYGRTALHLLTEAHVLTCAVSVGRTAAATAARASCPMCGV